MVLNEAVQIWLYVMWLYTLRTDLLMLYITFCNTNLHFFSINQLLHFN